MDNLEAYAISQLRHLEPEIEDKVVALLYQRDQCMETLARLAEQRAEYLRNNRAAIALQQEECARLETEILATLPPNSIPPLQVG